MKNLLSGICLLLVLGVAVPAHGGLGENDGQMVTRYGASQAEEKNSQDGLITKCYSHGGFWIRVRFMDGASASEAYIKLNKDALSEGEITTLLDSNNRGSKWTNIYKGADLERWVLDSNGAVAQYYTKDHILVITTKELMRYIAEKGRLDEKRE
ncbi:MAG: hypothetical protein WCD79_19920 [Chthoniobacteraceae bacterium]